MDRHRCTTTSFRRVAHLCLAPIAVLALGTSAVRAQFTLLNQFANGPTNAPGYLAVPAYIGSVGASGQFVVGEGTLSAGNDSQKLYAVDGTYLKTLVGGVSPAPTTPEMILYSAIGPDGTSYASSATAFAYTFDTNGVAANFIGNAAGSGHLTTPSGVAYSPAGTIYIADAGTSHVNIYNATPVGGVYPLITSFGSPGTATGQLGSGALPVATDATGSNIYVGDATNHRVSVFSSAGAFESTIGDASGPGHLTNVSGVAVSGTGRVYVTDGTAGIKVYSTAGTYLETLASTVNSQSFSPATVSVAPTGMVYAGGGLSTPGAYRFFDAASWAAGTNTFTNAATGPTSVGVGSGQLFGTSLTLGSTKGLVVGATTTVGVGGTLNLSGGSLSTDSLVVDASATSAQFTMTGGTLTANSVTVQNGGSANFTGAPVSVTLGGALSVADSTSQFQVDQGATFSTASVSNHGSVTVGPNAHLVVGSSIVSTGLVTLNGGEIDLSGLFANAPGSTIQGSGTLSTTSGTSNAGMIHFTGQSSVLGSVNNLAAGGTIEVSGAQSHTFANNVINNGTFTIDPGSTATFQGMYSGAQGVAGAGTATFAGGMSPTGPVDLAFGGNVVLQHSNITTMHINSTGNDQVNVTNQLSFDGTLNIALQQSFAPQYGQSFHLFTWGSKVGSFSQITLPALAAGLSWDASPLYTAGSVRVSITGDANGDGVVNGLDISLIAGNWLHSGTGLAGDVNNDGFVNGLDIGLISSNWLHSFGGGTSIAPTAAVPEPASLVLAALGAVMLLAQRRKG